MIKLLESLNAQVNDAVKRGLGLEDTKKAVNLDFVPRASGG